MNSYMMKDSKLLFLKKKHPLGSSYSFKIDMDKLCSLDIGGEINSNLRKNLQKNQDFCLTNIITDAK